MPLIKFNFSVLNNLVKNEKSILFSILFICFCFLSYVKIIIFKSYPLTADEHQYFMQAFFYKQGSLCYDFNDNFKYWFTSHTAKSAIGYCSAYLPGYSIILTAGMLFGIVEFVNPILATFSLYILYKLLDSFRVSTIYKIIGIILTITNPYFCGYVASYFSQILALFLTISIFLCMRYYQLYNKSWYIIIAGFCVSYLFLTRQLDGVCLSLLLLCFSLTYKVKSYKSWLWLPIYCLGITIVIAYIHIVFQRFGIATTNMKRLYPIVEIFNNFPTSIWKYITWYISQFSSNYKHTYLNSTFKFSGYILYSLAFFGVFYTTLNKRWRFYSLLLIFIFVLAYNGAPFKGWPAYGARYTYPLFPIIVVLAICFLEKLPKKISLTIAALVIIFQFYALSFKLYEYSNRFKLIEFVWKDIADQCPDKSAVVLPRARLAPAHFIGLGEFRRTAQKSGFIPYNSFIGNKRFYITVNNRSNIKSPDDQFIICKYRTNKLKKFFLATVKKNEKLPFYVPFYDRFNYPKLK